MLRSILLVVITLVFAATFAAQTQPERVAGSVAQTPAVTIAGSVNKPGRYSFSDSMTVADAIKLAGGTTETAGTDVLVYRKDQQGVPHQIHLVMKDVLERKQPDTTLQSNDMIYIPDSRKPVIDDRLIKPNLQK